MQDSEAFAIGFENDNETMCVTVKRTLLLSDSQDITATVLQHLVENKLKLVVIDVIDARPVSPEAMIELDQLKGNLKAFAIALSIRWRALPN